MLNLVLSGISTRVFTTESILLIVSINTMHLGLWVRMEPRVRSTKETQLTELRQAPDDKLSQQTRTKTRKPETLQDKQSSGQSS